MYEALTRRRPAWPGLAVDPNYNIASPLPMSAVLDVARVDLYEDITTAYRLPLTHCPRLLTEALGHPHLPPPSLTPSISHVLYSQSCRPHDLRPSSRPCWQSQSSPSSCSRRTNRTLPTSSRRLPGNVPLPPLLPPLRPPTTRTPVVQPQWPTSVAQRLGGGGATSWPRAWCIPVLVPGSGARWGG